MSGMQRASRWGTRVLAAWLATCASAAAQDVCVDPAIERELAACPEAAHTGAPRRPGRAILPARRDTAPAARPTATPGAHIDDLRALDPREDLRRRDHALLERERTILERLVARTPPRDPDRPATMRRLAETYAELVQNAEVRARSLDEPIFRARGPERERLERAQHEQEARAQQARESAVRVLARLVADHPSDGHTDESLYTLAYHLERMRQRDRALQVYVRLIRDYSASRYVPHAYLALAERAFEEGSLDDARELYERVLAYPPEHNPVYTYARYKLAWVHYNDGRFQDALEELARVIEHVRAHPDTADGPSIARQARREIVLPYSHVGRPERALAFFRRVGDDDDDALAMLERLGELYFDEGHWAEAITVHHRLMAERPRAISMCAWQARVLDATISSRPKREQVREAQRLLDVRALAAPDPDAAHECEEHAATSILLLATAWHREAIGTDDQPGTRDRTTMELASTLYDLLERELPELDRLALSSIDARDRPSRAQLAFFHGELLYDLEDWRDCASAYERALDGSPEPQLAADAAYGAVLCYDRYLGTREPPPNDGTLAARALTPEEAQMAHTFQRFACAAPDHEELPIVLYRWARLYYEANQFDRAAVLFERVATHHASSEVSEYAANLYLDSLNALYAHDDRPACYARLERSLDPMAQAYCAEGGAHPELCGVIGTLRCEVGAHAAHALSVAGEHRPSGDRFLALARTHSCREEDAYLYAAAMEYEAARLMGRAIRVRVALIEAHPESRYARRSVYLVGANYHALAIYDQAAEWYERYAREQGRTSETCTEDERARGVCPDAAEGLQNAVSFRLGLGDRERAIEDAHRLEQLFARAEPERTVEVALAIGALYTQEQRWREVVAHHTELLRRYGRAASPDEVARAEVAIGRALVAMDDRRRAEPHLRAAIDARSREGADGDPSSVARLHDAASEALFELAEAERLRFEAIPFPTLRGSVSLARVSRWASDELAPWLEQKRAAFQAAEEAYGRVHPLGVPRWRIASAARIGDMVAGLVEQVRGSPVPAVIERDPDLLDAYWEALDRATEPYLAIAEQRYAYCLATATEARFFDERSQHCERSLNRLDAARFPIAAELRGSPEYERGDPAMPTAPDLGAPREG